MTIKPVHDKRYCDCHGSTKMGDIHQGDDGRDYYTTFREDHGRKHYVTVPLAPSSCAVEE
tara:strand:+ start:2659 stop:2838 length:180 start_codon:yes stop_codon:yes gene_type:complete